MKSSDYNAIKMKMKSRIIGTHSATDEVDKNTRNYINKLVMEGVTLLETIDLSTSRNKLWSDSLKSNNLTREFRNIRSLAILYTLPKSKYFMDESLLNIILEAIDFLVDYFDFSKQWYRNWWDWQIGASQAFADIMILLDGYVLEDKIEGYAQLLSYYNSDATHQLNGLVNTGANLADSALVILAIAVVTENDDLMNHIFKVLPTAYEFGTGDDGMYKDGSLIQHHIHAYTGAYGTDLLKGTAIIISLLQGSKWEINIENTPDMVNYFEGVVEGYLPIVQNGHILDFVVGRGISRPPARTKRGLTQKNGADYMGDLLLVASFSPKEVSDKIRKHIKSNIKKSDYFYDYLSDPRDFENLNLLSEIANDVSILHEVEMKYYAYNMMTRALHQTPKYCATVSMTNKRIANYESINRENLKGWNTGDGALYIYTSDLNNFNESYRATLDYKRIPGTTTDTRDLLIPERNNGVLSEKVVWAGGVSNGKFGTASMHLDKAQQKQLDTNGDYSNLEAIKSYFFLEDCIVAIGSNINATSSDMIETVIENRIIPKSDDFYVKVNNKVVNERNCIKVKRNECAFYKGDNNLENIGYIFLEPMTLNMEFEKREGYFKDINEEFFLPDKFVETYFKMNVLHGQAVRNGSYSYMIYPAIEESDFEKKVKNNHIQIISQDENAHIIYNHKSKVYMLHVFEENFEFYPEFSSIYSIMLSVGSYILESKNEKIYITLSDSTISEKEMILRINTKLEIKKNKSESIIIQEVKDGIKVIFDSKGSQGLSQTIILE